MRPNRLKELWKNDQPAYGMWVDLGSPAAVEMMAGLGLDWLLLDCEHGVSDVQACFQLLQAMNGSPTTSVVRVPYIDKISVKRALDMGAEGILVPYVKTAEQVREIVSWCRYPPVGSRGLGPFRASRYELEFDAYYARANDEVAVIVQIETVEAVANLEEILAVPGLDAIFIGPADLSATMGYFPEMKHPRVEQAVQGVLKAARAKGIPVGYYTPTGAIARERAAQGFRMMNVGNDMVALGNAVVRELGVARGKAGAELKSNA